MKKINFKIQQTGWFILLIFSLVQLTSCENDFRDPSSPDASKPPVIHSVSEATEDVAVTQGVLQGTYIIRGEYLGTLSKVYFNGYQAGFNPAFVTDNIAFVTVPVNAPYVG